jgi:hypothetical protein
VNMPYHDKKRGDINDGAKRLQIIGPPYGMKTTVAGWLQREGLTTILGIPGEKHTGILDESDKLRVVLPDRLNVTDTKTDYTGLWTELRKVTQDHVGSKEVKPNQPIVQHMVFDGAHKAYTLARNAGIFTNAGKTDGFKAWDFANEEFLAWFQQGYYTPHIEWVVWLAWSAKESVGEEGSKVKTTMPDYMGKMQQTIVGETNIILQKVEGGKPFWQLRQSDDAMGIGIRTSPEKAEKLPVRIPADWAKLKEILQG